MKKIEMFDVVELTEDIPGTFLKAGMEGTVVDAYPSGGFEVEFEEMERETGDIVTYGLYPEQIRVIMPFAEMSRPQTIVNAAITTARTDAPAIPSWGRRIGKLVVATLSHSDDQPSIFQPSVGARCLAIR